MHDHTLVCLEFDEIVSLLGQFASSELGRRECRKTEPLCDLKRIEESLCEVTEFKEVLEGGSSVPLQGMRDIEPILRRSRLEGAVLQAQELLDVAGSATVSIALKTYLENLDERSVRLREIGASLNAPRHLVTEIEHAIGPGGEILDEASPRLAELRSRIPEVREHIKERLASLLRRKDLRGAFPDEVITQRNNRYVILIRVDFSGRVKGIVHDYSHSGASLFVEPMGVVELNNELSILLREEEKEEEAILRRLSGFVRERREVLFHDLTLQGRVDAISAKARLSVYQEGNHPAVNTAGRVHLVAARHPLLIQSQRGDERNEVVPIDLHLDRSQSMLVISGANTGGKTVALKTLGILSLMAQAGLHIPVATDSEVNLFDHIFAYVGDEQNLREHLSTFSSFILWLNDVLEKIDDNSLLLIDEIGAGTEHAQGAALAMGLLDYIRDTGAYAAVTTHCNDLKAYALRHADVTNVAVEFDQETLQPTYRLLYGVPGTSHTFLIAEKLGLKQEVFDRFRGYQDRIDVKLDQLIAELGHLRHSLHSQQAEAEQVLQDVSKERERLREAIGEIQGKKREILKRAEEEGKRVISSLQGRLKEVLRKAEVKKEEVAELKGEFKRIVKEDFTGRFPNRRSRGGTEAIEIGDRVRVMNLGGKEGVVEELSHDSGKADVSIGGVRVKANLDDLQFVSREIDGKEPGVSYHLSLQASDEPPYGELNVVGFRVGEALPKVDKFLDDAMLRGWERIHIIHGIGSGRLREAIRGHLGEHRWVKAFRGGDVNEGGAGITVVELR